MALATKPGRTSAPPRGPDRARAAGIAAGISVSLIWGAAFLIPVFQTVFKQFG